MLGTRHYNSCQIDLFQGDLTKFVCDAMVNAANDRLAGGGGVDGAIHREGGPDIAQACQQIGKCPTGEAVVTRAGKLPAKWVIHTVGPRWKDGSQNEPTLLASAYRQCLSHATRLAAGHVAFPSLATGAYGYPIHLAAKCAMESVHRYLKSDHGLSRVTFVLFTKNDYDVYQKALFAVFSS